MKYAFTTVLFLLFSYGPRGSHLPAQNVLPEVAVARNCSPGPSQEKYNHYRLRFLGDGTRTHPGFVRMGDQPGESLPVDALMPSADCYWDYILNVRDCNTAEAPGPIGKIRFSDASQDLGYYIGVLASEYEVNRIHGENQNDLIRELWLALKAFERLDAGAEQWYGEAPLLDGFFLRDDVIGDFYQDDQTGAYLFPHPNRSVPGYQCLSSAWSCGPNTVDDGTFVSQDQMIYVMTGLALVDRFIPETVVYNRDTLVKMARLDVHRMVSHLRDNNWTIRAPDGTTPPDQYGGNAQTFSFKFAELADVVTGNRYYGPTYQNNYSEITGATFWFFVEEFFSAQVPINKAMILTLSAITRNWDAVEMADKASDSEMELFALLQSVLYREELGDAGLIGIMEGEIENAPTSGPCNHAPDCEEVPGWQTSNRWLHPDQRNGDPDGESALFNGLDFMILYNLLEIYKNQQGIPSDYEPCPNPVAQPEPLPTPFPEILIYPVPVRDQLNIEFYSRDAGLNTVELFDLMGKRLISEVRSGVKGIHFHFQMNVSDLTPGVYGIRVTQGEMSEQFTVVKE